MIGHQMGWFNVAAVCALGLLGITGCQSGPRAPGAGQADPLSEAAYPQIAAVEGLSDHLAFGKPVVSRETDRPMSVTVPVRSLSNQQISVQYRFEFMDAAGLPLEPAMGWRFLPLPGRVQHFVKGAAIDLGAVDWRLIVRPAQ